MQSPKLIYISGDKLIAQMMKNAIDGLFSRRNVDEDIHLVLTGGRSGKKAAERLTFELIEYLHSKKVETIKKKIFLHIWFSDERFSSCNDPDRTDSQLIQECGPLADSLGLTLKFHQVATPENDDVTSAAQRYSEELDSEVGSRDFDLVILSMGEDGHIASLFPGLPTTAHGTNSAVAVDNSPKPPSQRVSISVDRLAKARAIYVLATGEAKRQALENVQSGGEGPLKMVSEVTSAEEFFIYTDIK